VIRDVLLGPTAEQAVFATVDGVGRAVVFLSTDAGASITGTACRSSGGWTRIDASDGCACVDRNVFGYRIQRS